MTVAHYTCLAFGLLYFSMGVHYVIDRDREGAAWSAVLAMISLAAALV